MSDTIKNWMITALCAHAIAAFWFFASPTTTGQWLAAADVAYDSVWSEHVGEYDLDP